MNELTRIKDDERLEESEIDCRRPSERTGRYETTVSRAGGQ